MSPVTLTFHQNPETGRLSMSRRLQVYLSAEGSRTSSRNIVHSECQRRPIRVVSVIIIQ